MTAPDLLVTTHRHLAPIARKSFGWVKRVSYSTKTMTAILSFDGRVQIGVSSLNVLETIRFCLFLNLRTGIGLGWIKAVTEKRAGSD